MEKTRSLSESNHEKSLITITSCNRLSEVKKYIWDYLYFVNNNPAFEFILALDGNSPEYIDFCKDFEIPLVYSNEREGVGLSKNRVLTYFPNYHYYFFIEDDIELSNHTIFKDIISTHQKSGVPHFCNHHKNQIFDSMHFKNLRLEICWTGGAQFAFYSNEGLQKVGGFNTLFAKYKRYGHTEHSYRYYHQGLQKGPFIFSEKWLDSIIIHSPPQVTQDSKNTFNELGLVEVEQKLIESKTKFFELKTISKYQFNENKLGYNQKVADFITSNPQKYPLTIGKERKIALAENYALRISKASNFFKKINLLLKSFWLSPSNVALKHFIKTKLFGG
ncbi:MAG: hypothetical protein COA32_01460 [Fluviicola sp.]|nr:MAG: hypothetical protein COA32_01460 [Fluviicola sp.]